MTYYGTMSPLYCVYSTPLFWPPNILHIFFDECPAYNKDETTACSLHMFWDLDLSKTAAAIAMTACVGSERQELAAAFRTADNTGAFALSSF